MTSDARVSPGVSPRVSIEALRQHGERAALEGCAAKVSYRLFAGRAAAVADSLHEMGVRPGQRVAILSRGRKHDEAVALAGIHLLGATAVPLDHSAPPARQRAILQRTHCHALVHDDESQREVSDLKDVGRVELDEEGFILASIGHPSFEASDEDDSSDYAFVLHTSGSTGEPKPIPLRWEGVDAFVSWMTALTQLEPNSRVLRVAELCFDLAVFDHLAAWRVGATLCTMSRRASASARSLAQSVHALAPSVAYAVPAWWMRLVDGSGDALPPTLSTICFAGEVYPKRALRRLADSAPTARLYNLFGPTETNVCCCWPVDRTRLEGDEDIPIGAACPYADCSLRGQDGATLDGAGIGELVVAGPTAVEREGTRTGDRVERTSSGEFYFRGRFDRMLKIAGRRVYPEEIERVLRSHGDVVEAAVISRSRPRVGRQLHAFVTSSKPLGSVALRKHVAAQLPVAMVPESVQQLDALPRTSTGKIDYAALAARLR